MLFMPAGLIACCCSPCTDDEITTAWNALTSITANAVCDGYNTGGCDPESEYCNSITDEVLASATATQNGTDSNGNKKFRFSTSSTYDCAGSPITTNVLRYTYELTYSGGLVSGFTLTCTKQERTGCCDPVPIPSDVVWVSATGTHDVPCSNGTLNLVGDYSVVAQDDCAPGTGTGTISITATA